MPNISADTIRERLRTVKDPELDLDLVTLGLIRDISVDDREGIHILMTLTSAFCPFGDKIVGDVEKVLADLHPEVRVDITFDPPWEPTEELKLLLGA